MDGSLGKEDVKEQAADLPDTEMSRVVQSTKQLGATLATSAESAYTPTAERYHRRTEELRSNKMRFQGVW